MDRLRATSKPQLNAACAASAPSVMSQTAEACRTFQVNATCQLAMCAKKQVRLEAKYG